MSDPRPPAPSRRASVKNWILRIRNSFKKRLSKSSGPAKSQAQEPSAQPATSAIPVTQPSPGKLSETSAPIEVGTEQPLTDSKIVFRTTLQRDKVQALFAKYGLEFDGENIVVDTVDQSSERIEKPIRMRVRRQCHKCQKTFSKSNICSQCDHRYCKECQRYPPKKAKSKRAEFDNTKSRAVDPVKDQVGSLGVHGEVSGDGL